MGELQLFLLGPPEIRLAGAPLVIRSAKARALLFYLAVTGRPHSRSHLSGLLWGGLPESNARRNLRVALHKLRRSLADYLLVDQDSLAINRGAAVWLDVSLLQDALGATPEASGGDDGTRARRQAPLPAAVVDRLRAAVGYDRGEFLQGFMPPDAPEFEAWVTAKREGLRQQLVRAREALADVAEAHGDLAGALEQVRAMLDAEPWREEAHRRLMRLLAQSGRRSEALAQYDICCQVLARELRVEPAPATTALYEEIRAADRSGVPDSAARHNLPADTTSFIGRDSELEQIAELLADPGCRLLTLFGPGGIGKTRLALQAARQALGSFAGGVFYVSLESITTAEQLPEAIASALGLVLAPQHDPHEQLLAYLHDRQHLLLLDNFEHLVSGADLLPKMLQAAPGLKLLVTTREALRLYEEWLMEVQGLGYPTEDGTSELAQSDAAALFLQRARRVNLEFSREGNETAVAQICRLLQGMPLGIELAAAWVRTIAPAEITRQIAADLDILTSSLRNVPARHRSMAAVFDHSWRLLQPQEKQLLRRLAVFRGGFTAGAAQRVVGASRRDLRGLVDKALLQFMANDRYDMHPLIHQYAAEKLAEHPQEESTVQVEHAAHFAAFLGAQESALKDVKQQLALQRIAAEMDNIRLSWNVACQQPVLLEQMVLPLFHFLNKRGQQREGFALFGRAVKALEQKAAQQMASETQAPLLARLLVRQGRLGEHISRDFDVPAALLSRGLDLAREHDLPVECAQALQGLGMLALLRGSIDQAGTFLVESLRISRRVEISETMAGVLVMLAWLRQAQGNLDEAKAMAREALAIHRDNGDVTGVAAALTALGTVHSELDEFEEAQDAFAEALAICRQSNHKVGESQALTGLFNVAYRQGDSARAADYARQSVIANREAGNRLGTAIACHNLGAVAASIGHHEEAVEAYREARDIYRAIKAGGARRSNNHMHLAQSLAALNETAEARRELREALRVLPEQARPQLAADLLLTAARLFRQLGDEAPAARLLTFLEEQDLLPATVDSQLTDLVAKQSGASLQALTSISEALSAVRQLLSGGSS